MVLDFVNKQQTSRRTFRLQRRDQPRPRDGAQKLYNMKLRWNRLGIFTPEELNEFAGLS